MNTTKKIKRSKILIVILSVIILLLAVFMSAIVIYGYYIDSGEFGKSGEYPLSKLTELNVKYIDLREIEGLPNVIKENDLEETLKSNPLRDNYIEIRRESGTNGVIQIKQRIVEDDYEASLQTIYAIGSTQQKFDKYINENVYFMFITPAQKVLDERFDLLAIYQGHDYFLIIAQKGLKAIRLSYSGRLEQEIFLQKINEIFK
jgi:hypothetical protein